MRRGLRIRESSIIENILYRNIDLGMTSWTRLEYLNMVCNKWNISARSASHSLLFLLWVLFSSSLLVSVHFFRIKVLEHLVVVVGGHLRQLASNYLNNDGNYLGQLDVLVRVDLLWHHYFECYDQIPELSLFFEDWHSQSLNYFFTMIGNDVSWVCLDAIAPSVEVS